MHFGRKAIIAIGVTGAVVAGGAAAYAATTSSSTGHDPQPAARAGHGPGPFGGHWGGPASSLPAGTRTVIDQIRTAVLDQAAGIVTPVIDQAVTDGKLTAAQAATAKQALADVKAGQRPSVDALALLRDADARAVAADAFQALAKQVPAIAKPILADAVTKGTIDQATADAITQRIQGLADRAAQGGLPFGGPGFRGGPGFGHRGGPGFGHHGSWGPGRAGRSAPSAATAGVIGDIAQAIAKQAPSVAGPIIDQAIVDGKLTQAQSDELKSAAGDIASGGPRAAFGHGALMADADVRAVVRDVIKALAKQAPSIAKPIIGQAVADGKLTQAQADEITEHIADAAKRAGG
jgi:polyhydroxyalkanoate synthesis regulator phasin